MPPSRSQAADHSPREREAQDRILILDFGSQFTQLIARRVREHHVYCEIHAADMAFEAIEAFDARGIILSGGPSSVHDEGAPDVDPRLFELGLPVLGICYGLQLLVARLGGRVEKADESEYGRAYLRLEKTGDRLFEGLSPQANHVVWMSHGDRVLELPPGYEILATSDNSPFAAIRHCQRPIWGLQFHPEVVHTEGGRQLLANFVHEICGCRGDWTMDAFIDASLDAIRGQVGDGLVVCGLSGGVDSSVAAALVHRRPTGRAGERGQNRPRGSLLASPASKKTRTPTAHTKWSG